MTAAAADRIKATVEDLQDGDVFSFPGDLRRFKLIGSDRWGRRSRLLTVELTLFPGAYERNGERVSGDAATGMSAWFSKRSTPVYIHHRPGPSAHARRTDGPPPVNTSWWPRTWGRLRWRRRSRPTP